MSSIRRHLETINRFNNPADLFNIAIYHYDASDLVAEIILSSLLNEAKKLADLGAGKRIAFHKAHVPNGQDHLHFLVKGASIYAINQDGSAHDQSHGVTMQKWAIIGAQKHYPAFTMPKDGLIECLFERQSVLLLEDASSQPLIAPALRTIALQKAIEIIQSATLPLF